MIVDFHTHAFPDSLAPRAIASLAATAEKTGMKPRTDGTIGGAIQMLRACGIDRGVVCNIATNPHQQSKVNDFAIATNAAGGMLTALGSVHPDSESIEDELDRLVAAGIRGIKIHPDYVGIDIDDARFDRIFDGCTARGLFVITHAGYDPISPAHMHADPIRLRRVLDAHPALTLIAAHVGGMNCPTEVLEHLVGTRIYLDTSLAHVTSDPATAARVLREHDPARILFATDLPWGDPAATLRHVRSLGLPERIFAENAMSLLR